MPVVWAAISAHGYGHAAQVVPVLNALAAHIPKLRAILRTTVPGSFFQDRLTLPWSLQPVQQDIGCIQEGPLRIDIPATWTAHCRYHQDWEERLGQEVAALRAARPRVIIADTPYLACAAGFHAGVPAVGLANFTWSEILTNFGPEGDSRSISLLAAIDRSYRCADFGLRIAPGLPLRSYQDVIDIGPIAEPAAPKRDVVRSCLQMPEGESLVLIAFGGVRLTSLPFPTMEQLEGYRFLVDGPVPDGLARSRSLQTLPLPFKSLFASVDVVMTKPGYGTVVEAVALGIPVVYVRRNCFADEHPLVDFLKQYGRASELSSEDFSLGRWKTSLDAARRDHPQAPPPDCTGAADAVRYLLKYF